MATRNLTRLAQLSDNYAQQVRGIIDTARNMLQFADANNIAADLPAQDGNVVGGAGSQTKAEFIDELKLARAVHKRLTGSTQFDALPLGAELDAAQTHALIEKLGV